MTTTLACPVPSIGRRHDRRVRAGAGRRPREPHPAARHRVAVGLVTRTTSGAAKAVPTRALWPSPADQGDGEPAATRRRRCRRCRVDRGTPRWSVVPATDGVVARVDGRAAGQQGHRLGRAAVVAQRRQQGVERRGDGAGQVGADPAGAAVGLADQVVALGGDDAADVGAGAGRVRGDDRVDQFGRSPLSRPL